SNNHPDNPPDNTALFPGLLRPTGSGTLHGASTHEILPGVFKQVDLAKFLVLRTVEGKPVMGQDIFCVHKSVVAICGREPKLSTQQDGSLLVEVSCPEKSAWLRTLSEVPGAPVSCTPHSTFNQWSCSDIQRRSFWRSSKTKSVMGIPMHRFCPDHKAWLTVATTMPQESSVLVLNSAPTPDSMPPILVHMDEAGTSATPHLSSTSLPGTTKISAKYHRESSRVSGGDDPLAKMSMVESSDCYEESETYLLTSKPNFESQTLQQMSSQADHLLESSNDETLAKITLAAWTPGAGVISMDPPSREHISWCNLQAPTPKLSLNLNTCWGPHTRVPRPTSSIIMATIVQWNCRGLLAHWEELQLLLSKVSPICICLQETMNWSFLSSWQEATVVPFKKTGREGLHPLDYRPIALTSCICKLFEKMSRLDALELMLTLLTPAQDGEKSEEETKQHIALEKACGSLLP
ncbi:putative RNA-directed DNA polymerase from transposon BS-like 3, partial [Homarus americanus]